MVRLMSIDEATSNGAVYTEGFIGTIGAICGLSYEEAGAVVDNLLAEKRLNRGDPYWRDKSDTTYYRGVQPGFIQGSDGALVGPLLCQTFGKPKGLLRIPAQEQRQITLTSLQRLQALYALEVFSSQGGELLRARAAVKQAENGLEALKNQQKSHIQEKDADYQDRWVTSLPAGKKLVALRADALRAIENAKNLDPQNITRPQAAPPLNLMDMDLLSGAVPSVQSPASAQLTTVPESVSLTAAQRSTIKSLMVGCLARGFVDGAIPTERFTQTVGAVCGLGYEEASAVVNNLITWAQLNSGVVRPASENHHEYRPGILPGYIDGAKSTLSGLLPYLHQEDAKGFFRLRSLVQRQLLLSPLQRAQALYALETYNSKGGEILRACTAVEQAEAGIESLKAQQPAHIRAQSKDFQDRWVAGLPAGHAFNMQRSEALQVIEDARK
jgi:hypothetical protein